MIYRYLVNKEADNIPFQAAIENIKRTFPLMHQKEPLVDVDGSIVITFSDDSATISATNDYYSDLVYIDSNISLETLGYPFWEIVEEKSEGGSQ